MLEHSGMKNLGLDDIQAKVEAGVRLTLADGERLYRCPSPLTVGALAHRVRTRLHGDRTYFVRNRHINYTNLCVNGCLFCAFSRKAGQPGAFELSLDDILAKVTEPEARAITEIHMVGGCHPELPLAFFETVLREIKRIRPELTIKAFTAVEVAHFAKAEGLSVETVLERLREAGLDLLPGGGAEVFSPRIRRLLCPNKLSGDGWLEVTRTAHRLGIRSNATLLYGHLETPLERLQHLDALRRLQDETGGFLCFIPLPYQPGDTFVGESRGPTAVDDLKTMAISRLMLDNIPHLKAYWVMLTLKLAQVALHFGTDDLDGTVLEEKIGHMAGAQSEQGLSVAQLAGVIREAGFTPVQRDSYFCPIGHPATTAETTTALGMGSGAPVATQSQG